MPKTPEPAAYSHATYSLQLRLPGWLKNDLLRLAAREGIGLAAYCTVILKEAAEQRHGLPPAPPARAPLPTTADQIRAWATGETLLTPCGQVGNCPGLDGDTFDLGGVTFCRSCRIRLG